MLARSALAAARKGTGDLDLSFAAVYATQVLPETAAFLAQVQVGARVMADLNPADL